MSPTRLYVIAGEASGDTHAASLVRAVREQRPEWSFTGLGGDAMAAAGVELRLNLVDRSVMGISKVVRALGSLVDVAASFLEDLERTRPAAVICVDYPGLNLNLARMARARGIPVIYYICPQVWAWGPWRVRRVASRADLLLVILPFEESVYRAVHPRVHYVGNPLFDHLERVEEQLGLAPPPANGRRVGLFPGSRAHEVEDALPAMLRVARGMSEVADDLEFHVSCHRQGLREPIASALADSGVQASVVEGDCHGLQRDCYLSLVVSGTATLEQAFFATPMVVMYPARRWELALFRHITTTPYISLVNLVAGRQMVPEFLFTPGDEQPILDAAIGLLDPDRREDMHRQLERLRKELFLTGGARRAANRITAFLDEK